MLDFYKYILKKERSTDFLDKYLLDPEIYRLKKIDFFNGLRYSSDKLFSFKNPVTVYDCAQCAALLTFYITDDEEASLAALYHYAGTLCFNQTMLHADNKNRFKSLNRKSNEEAIYDNIYLESCLYEDGIQIDEVANSRDYPIVDSDEPKLSIIRLNEIILTALSWTNSITSEKIEEILDNIYIERNEDEKLEIGFIDKKIGVEILIQNNLINQFVNTQDVLYMTETLSKIVKDMTASGIITDTDLCILDDMKLFERLSERNYQGDETSEKIEKNLDIFQNASSNNVNKATEIEIINVEIEPIANHTRLRLKK